MLHMYRDSGSRFLRNFTEYCGSRFYYGSADALLPVLPYTTSLALYP